MSKELKQRMTAEYKSEFSQQDNFLVVGYSGKEANDLAAIRTELRRKNVRLKVIKNSLAKLALKEIHLEALENLIDGPTAICFGGADIVELAKTVNSFAKGAEKIELRGGIYGGTFAGFKEISRIASIPPRDILYAQVAAALCSPLAGLAAAMNEILAKTARLLKALAEKKESEEKK